MRDRRRPMSAASNRESILALVAVGICLALFAFVFLPPTLVDAGGASIGHSYDFRSFFYSKFIFGTEEMLQGRLPLWNRYEFGGMPFLATSQPSVLYPPKILVFAALPPRAAHLTYLIGHLAFGALGLALLLRQQGLRGAALFVGPALFVFATPILASTYNPTRAANMAWVPMILLLVERLARTTDRKRFVALALVVALQLVAGYPVCTVELCLLVAVHATVQWASGAWGRPPWRTLPIIGSAFAVAALIAAAQLLPLAELAIESKRTQLATVGDFRSGMGTPPPVWLVLTILFPTLAPFAYIAPADRRCVPAAAGIALCGVMGTGGWALLKALPGFSMIRFPWTWVFVLPVYMGWLAAVGYQSLLDRDDRPRTQRVQWIVLVVLSLAWAAFAAYQIHAFRNGDPVAGDGWQAIGDRVSTVPSAALAIAGATLICAAFIRFLRRERARWLLLSATFVLTVSQLAAYPFSAPTAALTPPTPSGVIGRLRGELPPLDGRVFSMDDSTYGYTLTDRVEELFGIEFSFPPVRARPAFTKFRFLPMFELVDYERMARARGYLDLMNLQYLVAPSPYEPRLIRYGLVPIRRDSGRTVFLNPDRMGPAWVSHAVRTVHGTKSAAKAVLSEYFDPRDAAVVEHPLEHSYPRTVAAGEARITPADDVRVVEPTRVEIDVDVDRPGVLVLSESPYPGWQATLDGAPLEWFPVDLTLRGAEVPAGSHTVIFEYRPWSVRWGLGISAAALCGVVVVLLSAYVGPWRQRRAE